MSQQLSKIVVTEVVSEVPGCTLFLLEASGCPDCLTPVYDAPPNRLVPEPVKLATILFAPVAGFRRMYVLKFSLFVGSVSDNTSVIATPA